MSDRIIVITCREGIVLSLVTCLALYVLAGSCGAAENGIFSGGRDHWQDGPVDYTVEPVLSGPWTAYVKKDGNIWLASLEHGARPALKPAGQLPRVLYPELVFKDGHGPTLGWLERSAGQMKACLSCPIGNKTVRIISQSRSLRRLYFTLGADETIAAWITSGEGITLHLLPPSWSDPVTIDFTPKGFNDWTAIAPLTIGRTNYLFFVGIRENRREIAVLNGESQHILQVVPGVSFLRALDVAGQPAVLYKTFRDRHFILEGLLKKTGGQWTRFTIPQTRALDVARIDAHAWPDNGRILVVYSGAPEGKMRGKGQRIYAAASNDFGKTWSVRRLDRAPDNARSWLPRLAVLGDRVAAVWEDGRDIRSRVRLAFSPNRGRTWSPGEVAVSAVDSIAFRPRIQAYNNKFYIAWHQFRDDARRDADIHLARISWDEGMRLASEPVKQIPPEEKRRLLATRVNTYWQAMLNGDHQTTYALHDPFFRARMNFESYVSRRGSMRYLEYEIREMKIRGNTAYVKVRIRYEVPRIRILGRDRSIPATETIIEDTYLYLDDTWFRKYIDPMSGGSAVN